MKLTEKIFAFFNTDTGESVGAFFTGEILSTILAIHLLSDVAWPIFLAVMTGLAGGAAALLGKDLYKWIKKKIIK